MFMIGRNSDNLRYTLLSQKRSLEGVSSDEESNIAIRIGLLRGHGAEPEDFE